jgi:ATP/maltotriose-dependent transcriptional regulator MalT
MRAMAIRLADLLSHVDTPFGEGCLRTLSDGVADIPVHVFPAARPTPHLIPSAMEQLSPRECEVLRLVADGLTNLDVAERLVVSTATVKKHLEHIYAKLGAHTRTAAVARARALSLIA